MSSKKTVEVGHPYIRVSIATEMGLLALETDIAISSNNFDGDILSLTTNRDMGQDCPTFTLDVAYRRNWYEMIGSNDLVKIEIHRPPEEKALIFVGLVDDIRKTTNYNSGKPTRAFTVSGRGFNKALLNFIIGPIMDLGGIDVSGKEYSLVIGAAFEEPYPGKIMSVVLDHFLGKGCNYSFANGENFISIYRQYIEDNPDMDEVLIDDTTFISFQGSLWDFIKEIKNTPFNELFWEIVDGHPSLIFRPTPFNPERWGKLDYINLQSKDIINENLGRSDLETYTIYKVYSQHFATEEQTMVLPYWYPAFYPKYGLGRFQVSTKYDSFKEGQREISETYLRKKTIDLFNWNIKNNMMENGSLLVKGSVYYHVGNRLKIEDTGVEYYIEAVSHQFSYGIGWTTNISVTRGISEENRFTSPWGDGIELNPESMSVLFGAGNFSATINSQSQSNSKPNKGQNVPTSEESSMDSKPNNPESVNKVLSLAREKIGDKKYINWCLQFVSEIYSKAGYPNNSPKPTARASAETWGTNHSKENIPIGACVYFNTSGAGHIGIYTGNGKMIDAGSNGVEEREISDWYWNRFMGWGYHGGKPLN